MALETAPLIKHGNYMNPNMQAILDATGASEAELKIAIKEIASAPSADEGGLSGWVKTYGKTQRESETPFAFDLIANASDDAILYASPQSTGIRGLGMVYGMIMLGVGAFGFGGGFLLSL